jgi:hypothetical protein
MKMKISHIALIICMFTLIGTNLAFAQGGTSLPTTTNGVNFLPELTTTGTTASKLGLVKNLPKANWTVAIGTVINIVLAVTGSLAFLSFTYGGIMMVTAEGDEAKYKKGRSVILMSVLALIIIAASYAIVLGISQLNFFQ